MQVPLYPVHVLPFQELPTWVTGAPMHRGTNGAQAARRHPGKGQCQPWASAASHFLPQQPRLLRDGKGRLGSQHCHVRLSPELRRHRNVSEAPAGSLLPWGMDLQATSFQASKMFIFVVQQNFVEL